MNQERKMILKSASAEIMLPVTPESYEVATGINTTAVNVVGVGDVVIAGNQRAEPMSLSGFFPAQSYGFAAAAYTDPYLLRATIEGWVQNKEVVRFIVSGTSVNLPMIIEGIQYGERDGSNDVYYTIDLMPYTYLSAPTVSAQAGTLDRPVETPPAVQDTYTVVKGDTLWELARKYYGDPQLAYKMATANNITNPNLIFPGQELVLPEKKVLEGYEATR